MKYPTDLPCPQISDFGASVESGAINTGNESGSSEQRRVHRVLPHIFSMSFVVAQTGEYSRWLTWVKANAYSWFDLDLPSSVAGSHNAQLFTHKVRFVSDLKADLIRTAKGYFWRVQVSAEFFWAAADHGVYADELRWIIAKTPGAPASPDWIIARHPFNLPADTFVAGSPETT